MTNKAHNLLISETKLDSSFPLNQFHIDGFTTPYNEIENIQIEINLRPKNG